MDNNTVKIIGDFNQGIALMTIDPTNAGRFSKEAAQALLSRVYLYMENNAMAETMASSVINSGKYSLVDILDYPTQYVSGNSSEAIMEIQYDGVDRPGSNHIGGMYRQSGYGDYLPATDLLNMISATDIRGSVGGTMFFFDNTTIGGIYGNLRVDKWPTGTGDDNVPIIRLSEVYLIRAEARAKSGNDAGAQLDLNMIRQRADPTAAAVTLTGAALVSEVLIERRIELAFEGHGIFDFNRNKLSVVRDDCTSPAGTCTQNYPNDRFILAIPLQELDANPKMEQNPGY